MIAELANMTIRNPIFMVVFFAAIWYLPGIIIRRRVEYIYKKKKEKEQKERISSLYPKEDQIK